MGRAIRTDEEQRAIGAGLRRRREEENGVPDPDEVARPDVLSPGPQGRVAGEVERLPPRAAEAGGLV